LIVASVAKPSVIRSVGILAHESIIDCFIAFEDLAVDLALIVVPNSTTQFRKNGFDRKQKTHLLRFEDATSWIDEWNTLPFEYEPRVQIFRYQMVMYFTQPSHVLERHGAH